METRVRPGHTDAHASAQVVEARHALRHWRENDVNRRLAARSTQRRHVVVARALLCPLVSGCVRARGPSTRCVASQLQRHTHTRARAHSRVALRTRREKLREASRGRPRQAGKRARTRTHTARHAQNECLTADVNLPRSRVRRVCARVGPSHTFTQSGEEGGGSRRGRGRRAPTSKFLRDVTHSTSRRDLPNPEGSCSDSAAHLPAAPPLPSAPNRTAAGHRTQRRPPESRGAAALAR